MTDVLVILAILILLQFADLGDRIMATVEELNAKVDAILVNQAESADEVARIILLLQEIRANVGVMTQEQADALGVRLDEAVAATQQVEDGLRGTQ